MNEAAPPGLWRRLWLMVRTPHMRSMLMLGFSAGLPFFLVFSSLSAWLRQAGIQRSTIGMLAWVGLAYTFKFLWSPIVDRVPLPLLTRWLGRRRSWLLLSQLGIAFGLVHLSQSDPSTGVASIALWAVFTAFCSATQDIALDAWRIESAPVADQGVMVSAYQIGYRIALTVGSAGLFAIADLASWHVAYATMAALVGIGIVTTLLSREPQPAVNRDAVLLEERVVSWLGARAHWPRWARQAGAWFIGAVVLPLVDFFARYGVGLAITILVFLSSYRLTDFTMGTMTNSFYVDKGYTLLQVAAVVKVYGVLASIAGIILAGIVITRFGLLRSLVLGSLLVMTSNIGFSLLARSVQPGLVELGVVNAFDNLAQAIHGTSLIVFLSSLTSARYTATQYALFSSLYALPPKILEGFSGFVAESLGYANFFIYTASLSIPALLLLAWLARRGLVAQKVAGP